MNIILFFDIMFKFQALFDNIIELKYTRNILFIDIL